MELWSTFPLETSRIVEYSSLKTSGVVEYSSLETSVIVEYSSLRLVKLWSTLPWRLVE